ncbi:MAG: DNA-processing protein DprA, partial [Bacteroidaceae bacterium]|nr:DNA-processing protein DprA [Bacteroidaceae bacterium]
GSRRPSNYGVKMAEKIAEDLANKGFIIVSGMARGIDTCAHKGALKAGGLTIAVLGCGVDVLYPPENGSIKTLIEQNGAVVSEFSPGTAPFIEKVCSNSAGISPTCAPL